MYIIYMIVVLVSGTTNVSIDYNKGPTQTLAECQIAIMDNKQQVIDLNNPMVLEVTGFCHKEATI